jgi:hypothetical protein
LTGFNELIKKYPQIQVEMSVTAKRPGHQHSSNSAVSQQKRLSEEILSVKNLKKKKVISGYEDKEPPNTEGPDQCPYCHLCLCVIIQSPTWLIGSAPPNLGNDSKRYKLYRKFWRLLGQLGVWNNPSYIQLKQTQTTLNDPRDVMPVCVTTEVRRRFPNPPNIPYKGFEPT